MNQDSLLQLLLKEKEDNQRLQQELSHIRNALHDQQMREYETIIRDLKASLLAKEAEIRGLRGIQPQQQQQKLQGGKPPAAKKLVQGPVPSTNPVPQVTNPKPVVQNQQNKDSNANTKTQEANAQVATQKPQPTSATPKIGGQGRKRDRKRQDKQKDTAQKEKQDQTNSQQPSSEQGKQTGAQQVADKKNDSNGGQTKASDSKSTRHYKQRQPSNQSKQSAKPNNGTSQRRDRQRKKEGNPNPNRSSNGRIRGNNSANAAKSDLKLTQNDQKNDRKGVGQSNTGTLTGRKRPSQVNNNDDSLNRRRSQRNPRGQFIQIDGEFIQLPKDVDVPPTKKEKSSNEEKTYNHLMESSANENEEELSIHRNEDELDEERKLSNEFRAQSGTGGRLRCPAPSCGATRGLIQSMKQHVRETKGTNGHERVYCLKCDSVFFKSKDREEHDTLSNCIAALMSKHKAFLSTKQKDLVVIFEKENPDHHRSDSIKVKVEEQADENQQSEHQKKAATETSVSGVDHQENDANQNQSNEQVTV